MKESELSKVAQDGDLKDRANVALSKLTSIVREKLKMGTPHLPCQEEEDHEEDDIDYMGCRPAGQPTAPEGAQDDAFKHHLPFIKALPYCTPLFLGLYLDNHEWCCCPCSSKKGKGWRKKFGLDERFPEESDEICKLNQKKTPEQLMAHIVSKKQPGINSKGVLHWIVAECLDILYPGFKQGLKEAN